MTATRTGGPRWTLTLYVSGASPRSTEAVEAVRGSATRTRGQVDLTVLNAADHPDRVLQDHILAIPTLVKHSPPRCGTWWATSLTWSVSALALDLGPRTSPSRRRPPRGGHPHERPARRPERRDPELSDLRRQIDYLQETLDAISSGGVDAVVVGRPDHEQVYTLTSADRPYRVIVESMGEGAATVSERGVILFANPQLARFLGVERDSMIGQDSRPSSVEDQHARWPPSWRRARPRRVVPS